MGTFSTDVNDDEEDDDAIDTRNTMLMFSQKKEEGETTLGDFNIKGVIGKGTFGKVFLGELKSSGKLYAIKTLRKDVLVQAG